MPHVIATYVFCKDWVIEDQHKSLDTARFISFLSYVSSKFLKVIVDVWKTLTNLVVRRHNYLHSIFKPKQIKPRNRIGRVVTFIFQKKPLIFLLNTVFPSNITKKQYIFPGLLRESRGLLGQLSPFLLQILKLKRWFSEFTFNQFQVCKRGNISKE